MLRKYKVLLLDFDENLGFAIKDWLNSIEDMSAFMGSKGDDNGQNSLADSSPNLVIAFQSDNNSPKEYDSEYKDIPFIIIGSRPKFTGETNSILINLPLRFAILEAKIRQLLRLQAEKQMTALKIGDFSFSPIKKALVFGNRELKLTEKEISILSYLNQTLGASVGRDELLREVWRYNQGVTTHTLETHIYRLRQKLSEIMGSKDVLITTEGGYSLQI